MKHLQEAIAEAKAGRVPEGFQFSETEDVADMLAELSRLQAEVQDMLGNHGADDSGSLN